MSLLPESKARDFQHRLLGWYGKGKRVLPWRGRSRTPFEILVSELLLRKTGMSAVRQVYGEFLARFPSPTALANARVSEIRRVIGILGITDRARLFRQLGGQLTQRYQGVIPTSKPDLMQLAGVGEYTANAVLCFAYGASLPLVDSNVVRVLGRVFSYKSKKLRPHTDPLLWQAAHQLIAGAPPARVNRALLDFAGTVCVHRNPKCEICPMRDICDYYRTKGPEDRRLVILK